MTIANEILAAAGWFFFGSFGSLVIFGTIAGIGLTLTEATKKGWVGVLGIVLGFVGVCIWEFWVLVQTWTHVANAAAIIF